MVRSNAVHFISASFKMRGGDSEWLINYPRFIIVKKCVQNMSTI